MAIEIRFGAAIAVTVSYMVQKRGVCYFAMRIPADMRVRYPHIASGLIEKSLKSKDPKVAGPKAAAMAESHRNLWAY